MRKKTQSNPQIVIAIIGLIGTIAVALLSSPVLIELVKPSTPTAASTSTVIPTITPNTTVYGPENGELRHDGESSVETKMAGTSVENFMAEATFINPYSASEHNWDINIFFRHAKGKTYRVGILSEGKWSFGVELPKWKSLQDDTVFEKSSFNFKTEKGESNSIRVIAHETVGCFYLNNKFVGELDLSDLNQVGDIAVAIGSYKNSEQKDGITIYKNFSISRINDFSRCP